MHPRITLNEEIRLYVIHSTKHLIVALRNVLLKLEVTVPPDTDRESFAELKQILNQRIDELENCVASLPTASPHTKSDRPIDS